MKIPRIIASNLAGTGHYSKFSETTLGLAPPVRKCVPSACYVCAILSLSPRLSHHSLFSHNMVACRHVKSSSENSADEKISFS